MAAPPGSRKIPDAQTLRAVAHPIRSRLLALLRYEGPATASELGRRLGESSGSTSYHLRQLARYRFVEEDADQPNKRDKRWRAAQQFTSWSRAELSADAEGREISDALERKQLLSAIDIFQRWFTGPERLDPTWMDVGGAFDDLIRLTPSQLASLTAELSAVFRRYRTDPPPPADPVEPVGHVRVYQQLLPFTEMPL
jgi:DNA-binding transcriptional ArsR family regulator